MKNANVNFNIEIRRIFEEIQREFFSGNRLLTFQKVGKDSHNFFCLSSFSSLQIEISLSNKNLRYEPGRGIRELICSNIQSSGALNFFFFFLAKNSDKEVDFKSKKDIYLNLFKIKEGFAIMKLNKLNFHIRNHIYQAYSILVSYLSRLYRRYCWHSLF